MFFTFFPATTFGALVATASAFPVEPVATSLAAPLVTHVRSAGSCGRIRCFSARYAEPAPVIEDVAPAQSLLNYVWRSCCDCARVSSGTSGDFFSRASCDLRSAGSCGRIRCFSARCDLCNGSGGRIHCSSSSRIRSAKLQMTTATLRNRRPTPSGHRRCRIHCSSTPRVLRCFITSH